MAHNILTNTLISDNYIFRKQVEKLLPKGKFYLDNYERVRVDERTVILRKKDEAKDKGHAKIKT